MLPEKVRSLREILKGYEKCVIAFSGGVDSSLLLHYAVKELGVGNVVAVMFKAPYYSDKEQERGKFLAEKLGITLQEVNVEDNLKVEEIKKNLPQRCYICKKRGYEILKKIADEKGIPHILFGDNADDSPEFRPGMKAVLEAGGKMPLREVGLTKSEIKLLAQLNAIQAWAYSSNSCYLTRFPEGKEINLEKVALIKKLEGFIRQTFPYIRIRVREMPDGESVSIEVGEPRMVDFVKVKRRIVKEFEAHGYKNIYLHLNPKQYPLPQKG